MPADPPKPREPQPEDAPRHGVCQQCGQATLVIDSSLPVAQNGTYCQPCITRAWNDWERW